MNNIGYWSLVAATTLMVFAVSRAASAAAGDVDEVGERIYVWHFDEGSGDESAEASDGPAGVLNGDIEWVDGVSGGALEFSGDIGSAQYFAIPGDDHLDITESLTLAAWINIDAYPPGDQANKGTIVYKNTYYMQIEPQSGKIAYYFYDTAPEGYHLSGDSVKTGEWTHVAVTWDGSTIRYYHDGEQDPTEIDQSGPGRSTPAKEAWLGGENNACCPRFLQGRVDDLMIANYALSEDELRDYITTTLAVEPAGKLATAWATLKNR